MNQDPYSPDAYVHGDHRPEYGQVGYLNSTVPLYSCRSCGALVIAVGVHDAWHEDRDGSAIQDAIRSIVDGSGST